ncbi:MAG: extracellular solute-binding protein [Clostridiales bacterium]|nr:extracellular solute-binding protein [Clostridiales bacterium]
MLRYIIGITLITIGIIIVRAQSNGKVLKKHQYAFWLAIPVCMILLPFIKISLPAVNDLNYLLTKTNETVTYDSVKYDVISKASLDFNDDEITENTGSEERQMSPESDNEQAITKDGLVINNYVAASDNTTKKQLSIDTILKYISISVSAVMITALLVYNAGFVLYCRRRREFAGRDIASGLKIYRISCKGAPFLLFNKIYVDKASEDINEYIIRHEACHYKHGDHIWVLVRYLVLFINWYNPVIWAAFILSGRDCELACDEEVLRISGMDSSAGYVETLLSLLKHNSGRSFSLSVSTGMRGGYEMMKKRILSIKKPANNSRKALALCLASIMILSSCTFVNTSDDKKIKSNTPWYNAEILDFKPETDPDKTVIDLWQNLAGSDEKYIAVLSEGLYKIPDPGGAADMIEMITLIDRATKQTVKTINLFDVVRKHERPEHASYHNGKIIVSVHRWDPDTNIYSDIEYIIDAETEKLLAAYDYGMADSGSQHPAQYYIGDYRIEVERADAMINTSYYVMRVFSPDGSMNQVDVKDPVEGIYEIPVVFALDETMALVPASISRSYKYYKLDLNTCKLEEVNAEDYSWIDPEQFRSVFNASDGNVYFTASQGISRIDMKNKSFEEYMNYNSCSINMNYTKGLNIVDFSEDKILLGGRYWSSNMFESQFVSNFVIIELTKADKNPHAGKTIMELYIPNGEINETVSDAIIKYNETNKKYYIQVTDRYNKQKYLGSYGFFTSDDERDAAYMNADAQLSYELAMDIMNGEGPDILMNTSGFGQLNNDNHLVDLSPYLTDLDDNKYFTNIIEKAHTNGKLYQLPVSFTIEGIQTDPQYAGESGIGFTPEEYKEFLYGPLNGKDIIQSGQALYLTKLFNGMSDVFIKDGKVDLTGPEFEVLADYVRDNVPENSKKWFESEEDIPKSEEDDPAPGRNKTAYYCKCPGISGYLVKRARINEGTAILGIPSADGRGPMIGPDISVAVSTHAINKDACIEFVKLLLSDEVQSELALSDRFVLNRTEFRKVCKQAIEYYNSPEVQRSAYDYSIGTEVWINIEFTTDDIDNLEKIILSCSGMDSPDSAINLILAEEMPAYFLEQKDLASVVKIMQDRMQKVLDERG